VEKIVVYVDGDQVGEASYGRATPAIALQYPGYPSNANAGWNLSINSTKLSDGKHDLQAVVVDSEGKTTLIGERSFTIDNSN